jgi:predicted peptidase
MLPKGTSARQRIVAARDLRRAGPMPRLTAVAASLVVATGAQQPSQGGGAPRVSPAPPSFVSRSTTVDASTYTYQVFVPRRPTRYTRAPVILYLHGAGERGTDGQLQTMVGLGPVVKARAESFPAIVVFPQAPPDSAWSGVPGRAAMQALEAALREFGGDPTRIYLTGLSMGGYGTWNLALEHAGRFAALVPVCGGLHALHAFPNIRVTQVPPDDPDPYTTAAVRLAAVPIWLFHGEADRTVPVEESRRMADALRRAGAPVRYTEYPGVGHNSWESAYNDPELWRWLFAQRRARGASGP